MPRTETSCRELPATAASGGCPFVAGDRPTRNHPVAFLRAPPRDLFPRRSTSQTPWCPPPRSSGLLLRLLSSWRRALPMPLMPRTGDREITKPIEIETDFDACQQCVVSSRSLQQARSAVPSLLESEEPTPRGARRKTMPGLPPVEEDEAVAGLAETPESGAPETRPGKVAQLEPEEAVTGGATAPPADAWRVMAAQLELLQ
ncbi:unnamed protein product [Lampetra fluviatilis]